MEQKGLSKFAENAIAFGIAAAIIISNSINTITH